MIMYIIIGLVAGIVLGAGILKLVEKQKKNNAEISANEIVEEAKRNAEKIEKEASIKAKEKFHRDRQHMQKKMKHREGDILSLIHI